MIVLRYVLLLASCYSLALSFVTQYRTTHLLTILRGVNENQWNNNRDNDSNKKAKSTQFDRIIDDFIGKRYGAGEGFYGKRISSLSEEEYQEMRGGSDRDSLNNQLDEYENTPMQGNAILVVGDPAADTLQWIVFDLLEKGFNVRIACEDRSIAIDQFGLPGNNVDMIELGLNSEEERYARAVMDTQAVVFCLNLEPIPYATLGRNLDAAALSQGIAEKLLDVSVMAMKAKVGDIQKIVCVSRALPKGMNRGSNSKVSSIVGSAKAFATYLLKGPAFSVTNAAEERFSSYRYLHEQWEQSIRQCGIPYVIVRAPPVVDNIRPGAKDEMAVLTSQQFIELSKMNSGSADSFEGIPLSIAALDLAEATVQALLLQQVERTSFTVCARGENVVPSSAEVGANKKNPLSKKTESLQSIRTPRETYYGIISLDDCTDPVSETDDTFAKAEAKQREIEREEANEKVYSKMRSTYIIRPPESFRSQLEEDVQVEKYWLTLMKGVPKDKL